MGKKRRWWRTRKFRRLRKLIVWSTPLVIAGLMLFIPTLSLAKKWWSYHWLEQSQELKEAGNNHSAFQKAMSAYYWNPYDENIMLNLALLSSHVGHPQSLNWWLKVIDSPLITGEDILLFLQTAIQLKELNIATTYLSRFQDKLPSRLEAWQINIEILKFQLRNHEALSIVDKLLKTGKDDWYLHESKVKLLLEFPGTFYRKLAIAHLIKLSQRTDETGHKTIQLLFKEFSNELTAEQRANLLANLRAHPQSNREDVLIALAEKLREQAITIDDFVAEIQKHFNTRDEADLLVVCNWLAYLERYETVVSILESSRRRLSDKTLFLYMLNCRIEMGNAQAAYDMTNLEGKNNPLNAVENLVARARTQFALGDLEGYDKNLALAIQVADTTHFPFLEQNLIYLKENKQLTALYKRFLEFPQTELAGKSKLMHLYYQNSDERQLKELLSQFNFATFESIPSLQIFYCYLNLIYNRNIDTARMTLEEIVAKHPTFADFRISLAFAYYRSNQLQMAQELLKKEAAKIEQFYHHRNYAIAIATVQAAAGDKSQLQKLLEIHPLRNMLSREQKMINEASKAGSGSI